MNTEIIGLMVLTWNVESVGNVFFGVTNMDVFASCKERADVMF